MDPQLLQRLLQMLDSSSVVRQGPPGDPRSVVRPGEMRGAHGLPPFFYHLLRSMDPKSVVRPGEMPNLGMGFLGDPRSVVRRGEYR